MQIKAILHLIILYALFAYITGSETQNPSLHLYVDYNSSSSVANGTQSYPYHELSDAFDSILNSSSPNSEATIYIAAIDGLYPLPDTVYTFNNSFISSLTITTWFSPKSNTGDNIHSTAELMLMDRTLIFNNLAFVRIQNVSIMGKGNTLYSS